MKDDPLVAACKKVEEHYGAACPWDSGEPPALYYLTRRPGDERIRVGRWRGYEMAWYMTNTPGQALVSIAGFIRSQPQAFADVLRAQMPHWCGMAMAMECWLGTIDMNAPNAAAEYDRVTEAANRRMLHEEPTRASIRMVAAVTADQDRAFVTRFQDPAAAPASIGRDGLVVHTRDDSQFRGDVLAGLVDIVSTLDEINENVPR